MNNTKTEFTNNRRARRITARFTGQLHAKSKLTYKDWASLISENIKAGLELHAANVEKASKQISEQLEAKESSLVAHMKDRGLKKRSIDKLRDAWAMLTVNSDKSNVQSMRKEARSLIKQAYTV